MNRKMIVRGMLGYVVGVMVLLVVLLMVASAMAATPSAPVGGYGGWLNTPTFVTEPDGEWVCFDVAWGVTCQRLGAFWTPEPVDPGAYPGIGTEPPPSLPQIGDQSAVATQFRGGEIQATRMEIRDNRRERGRP